MERVNLDTTLNASELSEARAFFQRIQFHQEKNEFDRFETMIYEGNLIIYRQVSVKLLQAFRVLSKAVISQLRNFATSPQNLARVFVRLSALFAATAAVEPPTTIERVTMYADFLKVYIYKISLESKKDEKTGRFNMVPVEDSEFELPCEMVLIAAGFLGTKKYVADAFGVELDERTNVKTGSDSFKTNVPKVFAAGDMHIGQSLVVRAIKQGRDVAKEVDEFLMGYTNLE